MIWIVTAAAALLAVGAGAALWLTSRPASAEDVARTYLAALSAGDAAAIDALRMTHRTDDAETITREAFADARSHPTHARVRHVVDVGDGLREVSAQVQIGGEPRELTFTLSDEEGRWLLTGDDLATIRVDTFVAGASGGDAFWLGDTLAPAAQDIVVLPAEYEMRAAPRDLLSGVATTTVGTGETATIRLDSQLTPQATAAAQEQLDAHMDVCAAPADTIPDNCGIRVPWAVDLATLDSASFRIDRRPLLELAVDARSFAATGGTIVATVRGTTRSGESAAFTYRTDDWALRGSVGLVGDDMVLSVR